MKTSLMFIAALALLPSAEAAQPRAVGYVSMQMVLNEATETKAAAERIKATQQQKAGDLRVKQQALEETRRQLGEPAGLFQGKRLREQEERQRIQLEQATAQAQQELQTLQQQIQRELRARLKTVLDELARRHGLELVLNHDTSVLWAAPGLDLTAAVVERLNATVPAPTPAAAKPGT